MLRFISLMSMSIFYVSIIISADELYRLSLDQLKTCLCCIQHIQTVSKESNILLSEETDPAHFRTLEGLYIESESIKNSNQLVRLWTPFGEIKFKNTNSTERYLDIFKKIDWVISKNVTDTILFCDYYPKVPHFALTQAGQWSFKWSKIDRIERVQDKALNYTKGETAKLLVNVYRNEEEKLQDQELCEKLGVQLSKLSS